MALTNYWWLLIWLFVGGIILSQMPKRQECLGGNIVERWSIFSAILMVIPYIVWAGFRGNVADTWLYRIGYLNTPANITAIPSLFMNSEGKDPGYEAFVVLMRCIIGENADLFFLVIATFQGICMALVFRKYSTDYWICIFLFIASTDYMSWMMNGMRQFIAVIAIFACFGWMLRKKYVPLIGIILLVSTIHQSALLMIPIVFMIQGKAWNKKTVLLLAITMVTMLFIDRFTPIMNDFLQNTQYDTALSEQVLLSDDGTNILRVLVYSVPALLSLAGLKYVRTVDNPVINISVNCSIVTMAIYLVSMVTSGIYIGRLPIYTTLQGYIAVPWLLEHIFTEETARLVKCGLVVMFCIFFYYQMFVAWNY